MSQSTLLLQPSTPVESHAVTIHMQVRDYAIGF
jgi:hypothetical protein